MGKYVNPGNSAFAIVTGDETYVDKSGLIEFTNSRIGKMRPLICFSRPRRFGKSIAAHMLTAYYSKGCDSREIFSGLKIAESPTFERELNKNTVIYLDIQWIKGIAEEQGRNEQIVPFMQTQVIKELIEIYPDTIDEGESSLANALFSIFNATGERFIVIIDEWDCLFREAKDNQRLQDEYVKFLRTMFKGVAADAFIKLAYITGILPIKKYGTQSALNNFREYTMINPNKLAEYIGFTESEVKELCDKYDLDFEECKRWYDGYSFNSLKSVYSPNSVMNAIDNGEFESYWTKTETFETLRFYIDTNFDEVRTAILAMLSGEIINIDPETFQNDMVNIHSRDQVLTLFVHLGYLAYNGNESAAYIPNEEVRKEFIRATKNSSREELSRVIKNSDDLLKATLRMDGEEVAERIEMAHQYYANTKFYNNEQALRMVIMLAYVSRVDDYCDFQELPGGKGYADILFFPKKNSRKPALLIELKWNHSSGGAIAQIKEKGYCDSIKNYGGDILLVGINYDEKEKKHTCDIEKFEYSNN
ncbi:MAG: AAA family ATPase [Oscillospiraceae bacterium]